VQICGQARVARRLGFPPVGKGAIYPPRLKGGDGGQRGCEQRVRISFVPPLSTGCSSQRFDQTFVLELVFLENKHLGKFCAAAWDNQPLWTRRGLWPIPDSNRL
jgi:hypothetical protein